MSAREIDPISRELGEISAKLDSVKEYAKSAGETATELKALVVDIDARLKTVEREMGHMHNKTKPIPTMEADVNEMKPHVENLKNAKHKGMGAIAVLTLAAGLLGAFIHSLISKGG